MKNRILIVTFACFALMQFKAKAQNDILISNFMFGKISYNPAYVGTSQTIDATLLARQQWVGMKEAPSTQVFTFNNSTEKFGNYGLSVINDKLGYENSVNLKLIYAYPIRVSKTSVLSCGLAAGFLNRSIDGTQLKFENKFVYDPHGIYNVANELYPAIDFGLVYATPELNIGLSSTHLLNSTQDATFFNIARHYYFFGSYNIKINTNLSLVPSFYVKSDQITTQYEGNANLVIKDNYWIGASYRYNAAFSVLLGMRVHKNIKLAYAYDFDTGPVRAYSTGSHEIMLISSFNKPSKNDFYLKSPRLFN